METIPRRAIRWRNDSTRPANDRSAVWRFGASLLKHWRELLELWEKPVNNFPKVVNNWTKTLTHPYWNRHYSLASEATPKPFRLLGKDLLRDLLELFFPGAIRVSPDRWGDYTRLGGVDSNQKLRRAVLRLFGTTVSGKSYSHVITTNSRDFCKSMTIFASGCLRLPELSLSGQPAMGGR